MTSLVTGAAGLQALVDTLRRQGFTVIGPTVRDGAIVNAEIRSIGELPAGWGDEQEAAHYRLRRRGDGALFGFAAPASSAKPIFFPASALLWRGRRETEGPSGPATGVPTAASPENAAPYALFGIRSCDLHALAIHDRILGERAWTDDDYLRRRREAFIVAVTCGEPAGTCFCASTATGPQPQDGFDLRITELISAGRHEFLIDSGSTRGAQMLEQVPGRPADEQARAAAAEVVEQSQARMGRRLQTEGLREVLHAAADSPRWQDVASRCLSCANCTLVCPTCFCSSVTDTSDLADTVERRRTWASCFTADFSYLHGNVVRQSTASRYRQWMTHKLATWTDQFGVAGCVGCGRCITWCPAGIDITAEAAALQAESASASDDIREPS